MDALVRRIGGALAAWVGARDTLGEHAVVALGIGNSHSQDDMLVVPAYETPGVELAELLEEDTDALLGANPHQGDSHSSVVHIALRLRHLLAPSVPRDARSSVSGRPEEAAESLALFSDLLGEVEAIVDDTMSTLRQAMRDGSIVDVQEGPGAPLSVGDLDVEPLRAPLHALSMQLMNLSRGVTCLGQATGPLLMIAPRIPPRVEFVLQAGLWRKDPVGRYHVRVLDAPPGEVTVLLGDLSDNHSQSVTNAVEELIELVASLALESQGGAVHWVTYEAAPTLGSPTRLDDFSRVNVAGGKRGGTTWSHVDGVQLQQELRGGVERYAGSEYTSVRLRRRGVPLVVHRKG